MLFILKKKVIIWKGKVDRACIERLRGFGNPPTLVGQVMEMVMILIGKRLPSQRLYETRELTGKEEMSSRMSSSSSSTRIGVKKGGSLKCFFLLNFIDSYIMILWKFIINIYIFNVYQLWQYFNTWEFCLSLYIW